MPHRIHCTQHATDYIEVDAEDGALKSGQVMLTIGYPQGDAQGDAHGDKVKCVVLDPAKTAELVSHLLAALK